MMIAHRTYRSGDNKGFPLVAASVERLVAENWTNLSSNFPIRWDFFENNQKS